MIQISELAKSERIPIKFLEQLHLLDAGSDRFRQRPRRPRPHFPDAAPYRLLAEFASISSVKEGLESPKYKTLIFVRWLESVQRARVTGDSAHVSWDIPFIEMMSRFRK